MFLDIVINHTGWGSTLQENHPEWFLRKPDGAFVSPGAWGNDLGRPGGTGAARRRASGTSRRRASSTWCRRGVDGFRCDAGYKIPAAGLAIHHRPRAARSFPKRCSCSKAWAAHGKPPKACSPKAACSGPTPSCSRTIPAARWPATSTTPAARASASACYVHYSETHDNDRLAPRKAAPWSLLRNRLCALTSVSGGFGFTCGVEWLATEKIHVHGSTGLAWGNAGQPRPRTGAAQPAARRAPLLLRRRQAHAAQPARFAGLRPAPRLRRRHGPRAGAGQHRRRRSRTRSTLAATPTYPRLGQSADSICSASRCRNRPTAHRQDRRSRSPPGAVYCLAATRQARGLERRRLPPRPRPGRLGARRRCATIFPPRTSAPSTGAGWPSWSNARRRLSWPPPRIWIRALARQTTCSPHCDSAAGRSSRFPHVVTWTLLDARRVTLVPPGHWLLVEDSAPFRATLQLRRQMPTAARARPVHSGRRRPRRLLSRRATAAARCRTDRWNATPSRTSRTVSAADPVSARADPPSSDPRTVAPLPTWSC